MRNQESVSSRVPVPCPLSLVPCPLSLVPCLLSLLPHSAPTSHACSESFFEYARNAVSV